MAHRKDSFYFQKDAFVEKFRPLTYLELITGKPLIVPIPNSKFVFRANLQSVTAIARFNEILQLILIPIVDGMGDVAKKTALQDESFTPESTNLIKGMISIAQILFEFAEKPRGFLNKRKTRKLWEAFLKACLDDTEFLFGLLNSFRDYNQRFQFTMKYLRNYKLVQSEKWRPMVYSPSSPILETAEMRIRRRGLSFSPSEKLRKQAQSSHMN